MQGVDYAYTIHGWLKSVNSETLDPTRDIGLDGTTGGTHDDFAKDAFGFALHYYQGDYTAIKAAPGGPEYFLTDDNAFYSFTHNKYNAPRSLYNGNIMMMQTALMDGANAPLPEQRMKYEYDQLHRIKASNAYQSTTLLSTNQWDLSAAQVNNTNYQVLYAYDANGNMNTLNRVGSSSANYLLRDRFTYRYVNQTNRLEYVIDIKGTSGPRDMDTQAPGNYAYYEDGNLKSDVLDNISQIHWNVANKIDRIEFTPGATGKPEEIQFQYDAMGERIVKLVKLDASDQATWTYTYYVRDAQGNVMAVYERQTIKPSETTAPPGTDITTAWSTFSSAEYLKLTEQHLYGSSRLGILQTELALAIYTSEATPGLITNMPYWYSPFAPLPGDPCGCAPCANPPCDPCWCITPTCPGGQPCSGGTAAGCPTCYGVGWPTVTLPEAPHSIAVYTRGRKRYELSNHLGNVLAVISDRKLQIDGSVGSYNPDIWAYHDYYPFGMTLPDRTWQAEGYRYGFQGQEADDEVFGEDIAINYTFRMHDARIGRFLSIDPLAAKYPWNSPYAFSENRVIDAVELEGLESQRVHAQEQRVESYERQKAQASSSAGGDSSGNQSTVTYTSEGQPIYSTNAKDATISQYEPSFTEEWRQSVETGEASWGSTFLYDLANDTYVGGQDFLPIAERPRNLGGGPVSASERQDGAVAFLGTALGFVTGVAKPVSTRAELIQDLVNSNVKHNAEAIIHIGKNQTGQIIFLETGSTSAGFKHVLKHTDDFISNGIARENIADFVFDAAANGRIVGYQGAGLGRPIFEHLYQGQVERVAITIGDNGYIVGANPVSIR